MASHYYRNVYGGRRGNETSEDVRRAERGGSNPYDPNDPQSGWTNPNNRARRVYDEFVQSG